MTDDQLSAIERRCEAATGGLWVVVRDGTERSIETTESGRFICHLNSNMLKYTDDADFIANARKDVPFLVAEVRELREELERVQADFERYYRAAGGTL